MDVIIGYFPYKLLVSIWALRVRTNSPLVVACTQRLMSPSREQGMHVALAFDLQQRLSDMFSLIFMRIEHGLSCYI
jgi:hypothetical protein